MSWPMIPISKKTDTPNFMTSESNKQKNSHTKFHGI